MSTEVYERAPDLSEPERHGIVDVDVHPGPADPSEIRERMQMPCATATAATGAPLTAIPCTARARTAKRRGSAPSAPTPGSCVAS